MGKANASGALCALIVGEDEVKENAVAMKLLREDVAQTSLGRDSVLLAVRNNVPLERQAGPWPST